MKSLGAGLRLCGTRVVRYLANGFRPIYDVVRRFPLRSICLFVSLALFSEHTTTAGIDIYQDLRASAFIFYTFLAHNKNYAGRTVRGNGRPNVSLRRSRPCLWRLVLTRTAWFLRLTACTVKKTRYTVRQRTDRTTARTVLKSRGARPGPSSRPWGTDGIRRRTHVHDVNFCLFTQYPTKHSRSMENATVWLLRDPRNVCVQHTWSQNTKLIFRSSFCSPRILAGHVLREKTTHFNRRMYTHCSKNVDI